jgi:peptidoglycan/xylan/chitin deacetylase (PgdA/CDA1 family)
VVIVLVVALAAWALYSLPELLVHHLHLGAPARVAGVEGRIALTFDDGPGPATAEILETLAAHGARATFFLLAEAAERRPDDVRRILDAGCEVGLHGLEHKSLLLLPPGATRRQILEGKARLEAVAGRPIQLYRPPWGHLNLAAWWLLRRSGLRAVFWSLNAADWVPGVAAETVARRIGDARPGDIVLLHDAGGDGRGRTVLALPAALDVLRRRGLASVTVSELLAAGTKPRGLVFRLWEAWEGLFGLLWRAEDVVPGGVIRLTRAVYRGPRVVAPDGSVLRPGDRYVEVHFKNRELSEAGPVRGMRLLRRSLEGLARWLEDRPELSDVQFFAGITVLHRPAELFGFHAVDLPPGIGSWWAGAYRRLILRIYHREGGRRLQRGREDLVPKFTYITRRELLTRYGPGAEGGREA